MVDWKLWDELMGVAAGPAAPNRDGRYVKTGLVRASLRMAEAYAARLHRQAEARQRLMVHAPLGAGVELDYMPEACMQVVWWLARFCQTHGLDLSVHGEYRQNNQWTLSHLTSWAEAELVKIGDLPDLVRLKLHPSAQEELKRALFYAALDMSGLLDLAVLLDPGVLWRTYVRASEGKLDFQPW